MSLTSSPKQFSIFHKSEAKKTRRASGQTSTTLCEDELDNKPDAVPLQQILRNYATPTLSSILRSKLVPAKADRRSLPDQLGLSIRPSAEGIDEELAPIEIEKVSGNEPIKVATPSTPPAERPTRCQYDPTKAPTNPQACLLGLPVELRLMIFKHVFPPGQPRESAELTLYCAPALRVLGSSNAQLSRVNRQIYEETEDLLYGQTFVFLSREAMISFSATGTPRQLSHLRAIRMKPRITDWSGAIKGLVLPPAASLTIHWRITSKLWEALMANVTLDYREVTLIPGHEEQLVIFEPFQTACSADTPSYKYLELIFTS